MRRVTLRNNVWILLWIGLTRWHRSLAFAPIQRTNSIGSWNSLTPTSAHSFSLMRLHLLQPDPMLIQSLQELVLDTTDPSPWSLSSSVLTNASPIWTWLSDADGFVTPPETAGISYSKASYYTILALYVMSFPGLWSTVKRSTTAKIKRKTFITPGVNATRVGGKSLRQQAGEIMAYMKSNNYEVTEAADTITFRGVVKRSLSQAFFLTFCTALGLLSLALVLQIQFNDLVLPGIGSPNWFLLALASPYAGIYYWRSGDRVDDCSVKLLTNEAETENEIIVQGSEEELERMWRTLGWQEKGMVKVPGLLEQL